MTRDGRETSGFPFDAQGFFILFCKLLQSQDWDSDCLYSPAAHRAAAGHLSLVTLGRHVAGTSTAEPGQERPGGLVRPVEEERRSYLRSRTEGGKNSPGN